MTKTRNDKGGEESSSSLTHHAPPSRSSPHVDDKEEDLEERDDLDDERYAAYFESIRTKTGLEIGVKVTWPDVAPFELSTQLEEDEISPMFSGTQWAGTRIWRGAIEALRYLLSEECPYTFSSDTSVIELGCGLGVPGILLGLLKGCRVVLTDKDALVGQLNSNLQRLETCPDHNAAGLSARGLDWSVEGVRDLMATIDPPMTRAGFDVVLNCDCIYEPLYGESWKYLADCQAEMLRLNPATFMLTSVERRRADGVEHYLERVRASPRVDRVEQVRIPYDHPPEVEIYRIYGKVVS